MTTSNQNRIVLVWRGLCLFGAIFGSSADVHAVTVNANAPWQLLDGAFDSTVRGAWLLGLPDEPASNDVFKLLGNALLLMGADQGGMSRSVTMDTTDPTAIADFGKRWEVVNGGRGVSDDICGGYGNLVEGCDSDASKSAQGHSPVLYGGPPSAVATYDIQNVAASAWPASITATQLGMISSNSIAPDGSPKRATGLVYRTDGLLSVSPDAGRQWFPLAPQCALNNGRSGIGAIAVDRGVTVDHSLAGHVVVAEGAWALGTDIGGCQNPHACNNRQIAWTSDISAQVVASVKATTTSVFTATAAFDIDHAGFAEHPELTSPGWRYSMVSHLVRTSLKGRLNNEECNYDPAIKLTKDNACMANITADPKTVCHAMKASDTDKDAERFCPNADTTSCGCQVIGASDVEGTDGEAAHCDAPFAAYLEIDPRNGFVYASGPTGLLLARDGGRIWERYGAGEHNDWAKTGAPVIKTKVEARSPLATANPTSRGAKLLTLQGLPPQANVNLYQCPWCDSSLADLLVLDLNAQPEYIQSMSPISLNWQPCGGPAPPTYTNGRVRGNLVATVAVTWVNPRLPGHIDYTDPKHPTGVAVPGQVLSGVFVEAQDGDCSYSGTLPEPGPLVFRDSANLTPNAAQDPPLYGVGGSGTFSNDGYVAFHWDTDPLLQNDGTPIIKLPRFPSHPASTPPDATRCRMKYTAAAVAPSDSRILYTWAHGEALVGAPGDCATLAGLWRSLDRGLSWHPALLDSDPQATSIWSVGAAWLSVAPHSPYVVTAAANTTYATGNLTGTQAFLIQPAGAESMYPVGEKPNVDATGCAGPPPVAGTSVLCQYGIGGYTKINKSRCNPGRVLADICTTTGAPPEGTFSCSFSSGTAAATCSAVAGPDVTVNLPQCAMVPLWNQPTVEQVPLGDAATSVTVTSSPGTLACEACGAFEPASPVGGPVKACCMLMRDLYKRDRTELPAQCAPFLCTAPACAKDRSQLRNIA